jgi:hypothetical protein
MASEARTVSKENASFLAEWCGGTLVNEQDALLPHINTPGINVPVGDNVERASMGDTIIRKNDGSFEVVKHEWTVWGRTTTPRKFSTALITERAVALRWALEVRACVSALAQSRNQEKSATPVKSSGTFTTNSLSN